MSGIRYIANVLNQKGAPAIFEDNFANRPSAGYTGRIFISTDTFVIQRDNGTTWDSLGGGIIGSGVSGQVTFWTGASAVSGDNTFFWDNTNKRLGLGTVTPGVRLDIYGTNVLQQLNGTTTNSAFLDFQNGGTSRWRLGNGYNTAANDWQLIDVPNSLNTLTIKQNGSLIWRSGSTTFFAVSGGDVGDWEINKVRGTGGSIYNFITYYNTWNASGIRAAGHWFNTTRGASYNTYAATINGDTLYNLTAQGSTNTAFIDGGILFFDQIGAIGTYAPSGFNIGLSTVSTPSYLNSLFRISSAGFTNINTRLNINGATDNALFELNNNGNLYTGGISPTILTVAVNTTMARTVTGYYCTASLTLTLPSAASLNNIYWIIAANGVTVTVNRAGSDDILNLAGASVTTISVTSNQRAMFYVGGGTRTFLISQA